jgi:hypothetical protein
LKITNPAANSCPSCATSAHFTPGKPFKSGLGLFFGNIAKLNAPFDIEINSGNYLNQTKFTGLKTAQLAFQANQFSIKNLNVSILMKAGGQSKKCYFTVNIEPETCAEKVKMLQCCTKDSKNYCCCYPSSPLCT